MGFLTGMAGAALCMVLFGGGFLAGWKVRDALLRMREPSAQSPDDKETRRIKAETEAYQNMMNYSVETAYGLNKKKGIDA